MLHIDEYEMSTEADGQEKSRIYAAARQDFINTFVLLGMVERCDCSVHKAAVDESHSAGISVSQSPEQVDNPVLPIIHPRQNLGPRVFVDFATRKNALMMWSDLPTLFRHHMLTIQCLK